MPLQQEDVDYVVNDLRIALTGASDSGIKQAMWGVIKEFLQDSNAWVENQPLRVTAGTQEYTIVPRNGGQIIRLVGVLDGNLIPAPASMPSLGTLFFPRKINVTSNVTAADQPASTNPWTVCIVKNIDLPATKDSLPIAPEFVLRVYSATIIAGVKGRMMLQQGTSYTNLPLGKFHLAEFRNGIGVARNDTWNQNLLGAQRWAFPQQFATRSQRGYGSVSQPWPMERF